MVADSGAWKGSRPYSSSVPTLLPRQRLAHELLRVAEVSATVCALFVMSQAVMPLLLHGPDVPVVPLLLHGPDVRNQGPPLPIERLAYWFIYAFTASRWVVRPRLLLRALTQNPFVPAVVAIALLSASWSLEPGTTLRRAGALVMVTLFGLYLGCRYTTVQLLRLLGIVLGVIAVLSLAFAVLLPRYGIAPEGYGGAWEGVFTQKNMLGHTMLLGAIVFGLLAARRGSWRFVLWGGAAFGITLVALSRSVTAMVILGVLIAGIPLLGLLRRGRPTFVALLLAGYCALAGAGLIAVGDLDLVLSVLGRDVTLTGRTDIWAAALDQISQRPLLGFGYGTFWNFGPGQVIRAVIGWDTPHSHNGFLDLWLDLGLLGLLTFVAGFVLTVQRAWTRVRLSTGSDGVWPLTFLIMFFLSNITETDIYQSPFVWALFVATAAGVSSRRTEE